MSADPMDELTEARLERLEERIGELVAALRRTLEELDGIEGEMMLRRLDRLGEG